MANALDSVVWQNQDMGLWSTLVTGLVGIAGIVGAIVSSWLAAKSSAANVRLGIAAENERTALADRRHTYASCMTALSALLTAAIDHRNMAVREDKLLADSKVDAAFDTMYQRASELWLIAPPEVRRTAHRAVNAVTEFVAATHNHSHEGPDVEALFKLRRNLSTAMREDLGVKE